GEPLLHRELHAAQRRVLAGGIRVEAEIEALRELRQLLQLSLGERRSHGGDAGQEPDLAQREHVGVSLDDDGAVLLRDRLARTVEAVEEAAPLAEAALGSVDAP